uniref:Peptidase A1 domain-containing protein n=1 Tax=Chenopodium quinoa TaxID=63459 RepID=A0A803L8H3_CHEQI
YYALNGDLTSAHQLFDESPQRSIYLWNSIIRACAQVHDFKNAFHLFNQLLRSELCPDNFTFACILRACYENNDVEGVRLVNGGLVVSGLQMDSICGSSLVKAYSKLRFVDDASKVFNGVVDPDLATWNLLIRGYGYCGIRLYVVMVNVLWQLNLGRASNVNSSSRGYLIEVVHDFNCGVLAYTPWSDALYTGGLAEDVSSLYKQAQQNSLAQLSKVSLPGFPFTCADKGPLKGLSPRTKGVVTLARVPVALHSQISSTFKVPRKFALCLPSSSSSGYNGAVYFGGSPNYMSKSLITTPLIITPNSTAPIKPEGEVSIEYFIKALINVFVTKATAMKMTGVTSVAPFGACFSAKTVVSNAKTGPSVPIIDIIMDGKSPLLHNKNARWRIYGANSVVKVSENVMCLGFVDGGSSPTTSIVIGGKQMEDNLVEIDHETNKLGVTSSLLRMGTSCSKFKGI